MKRAILLAAALGCGGDDGTESPGGDGDGDGSSEEMGGAQGDGDGDADEPVCRTQAVANAAAGEKINAAYCFGLAYPQDAYACSWYPAENAVECVGSASAYVVLFSGDAAGDVYDLGTDEHLAVVVQGPTGAFEIAWDSGELGECTVVGDVATLCVEAP